ncbi:glycosyltransferase family 4 protein [Antrihabitans sp. YC3-6]|uniref:Glycosyltransferase family 4 protein n=1 Tax=Antrihabitans stalagmiti TaxID=2799499 RepID=A0A934U4E7_9NOCA|nr:glycosyltransferase family 4 protein [Antrihabitans stalagmiti]MBJ8340470.1 glycosyltransferase family 4 protein [Antrihabitans stalagmiti]
MKAFVPLPHGLSDQAWRDRHGRGEVPDRSPYGLHQLAEFGIDIEFGSADLAKVSARLAASVRYRTGGLEIIEAVAERRYRLLTETDVVLSYDERTGIPASLLGGRSSAPTVTGIGWLTDRASTQRAQAMFAARALPRAAAVWSQNAPILPFVAREWGVPQSRLAFVPLGIDTDFYSVQPPPEERNVVVSAGEDRYRDHALLIAAVAQVRQTHGDTTLELATGLPVEFPSDFGILHTGRLDGRMRDLYRRSSLVAVALHPTVTGSGLTVVLEAMASGRPIVVTDNPGVSDYVEDGETGVLVRPGDVDAFAKAIKNLLADDDRRIAMGHAASRRARERFTSGIMAEELARLLKSV